MLHNVSENIQAAIEALLADGFEDVDVSVAAGTGENADKWVVALNQGDVTKTKAVTITPKPQTNGVSA